MNSGTIPVTSSELDLIHAIASTFRVVDREDLESHLSAKLLELKQRPRIEIRDWNAYLAKFLYNKANNYARDERARYRRECAAFDAMARLAHIRHDEAHRIELEVAFREMWMHLRHEDRRLWMRLAEHSGNRSAAATPLHIHRNTVRNRLQRIHRQLVLHGLTVRMCTP